MTRLENDGPIPRFRPIRSGETFTFTTKVPQNLPLPSLVLLELQWFLQSLVGMCGAVGWPSLVLDDDSWPIPDYTDCNVHNSLKRAHEWVPSHQRELFLDELLPRRLQVSRRRFQRLHQVRL
jgi:hypothetical protein